MHDQQKMRKIEKEWKQLLNQQQKLRQVERQ